MAGRSGGQRPVVRALGLLAILAVACAGSWWAARATFVSPLAGESDGGSGPPATAVVAEASVGRVMTIGVRVVQPVEPVGWNLVSGVVTWLTDPGQFSVGDILFAVDAVPVRVVAGDQPFYRGMGSGDKGHDVALLQEALRALGWFEGEPDGAFGWQTVNAVRAWQADLGLVKTGRIGRGELVAVPVLPASLKLSDEIKLGSVLSGGEAAVLALAGERSFTATLTLEQSRMMSADQAITVIFQDRRWPAVIARTSTDESGNQVLHLEAPGGGPVCADGCDLLPADDLIPLLADVEVVPNVTGPAVPMAAVRTAPDGVTYVLRPDGSRTDVTVLGAGQGLAVIDGLADGETVVISSTATGLDVLPGDSATRAPTDGASPATADGP